MWTPFASSEVPKCSRRPCATLAIMNCTSGACATLRWFPSKPGNSVAPEFQCEGDLEKIHGAGSVPRRMVEGQFLRATEDSFPFRRNDDPQSLAEIRIERLL